MTKCWGVAGRGFWHRPARGLQGHGAPCPANAERPFGAVRPWDACPPADAGGYRDGVPSGRGRFLGFRRAWVLASPGGIRERPESARFRRRMPGIRCQESDVRNQMSGIRNSCGALRRGEEPADFVRPTKTHENRPAKHTPGGVGRGAARRAPAGADWNDGGFSRIFAFPPCSPCLRALRVERGQRFLAKPQNRYSTLS
jgi:hypothetical protein